jgi:hypothetical protein
MKFACVYLAALLLSASPSSVADEAEAPGMFAQLSGHLLLDNPRVHVERFVVAPGHTTGPCVASGEDALAVFIHGGVLRSTVDGRSVLWRDGRVAWHGAGQPCPADSRNAGATPIEFVWVTLKRQPVAAVPADAAPMYRYLNYPNIPGEDLFENDAVIVQRFNVNPGQWEGVHAHHPNMLYIHVRGGQWAARSKSEPEHRYPDPSPDGSVGWMAPIELSEGHESANVGQQPIDLIWVTLKR